MFYFQKVTVNRGTFCLRSIMHGLAVYMTSTDRGACPQTLPGGYDVYTFMRLMAFPSATKSCMKLQILIKYTRSEVKFAHGP